MTLRSKYPSDAQEMDHELELIHKALEEVLIWVKDYPDGAIFLDEEQDAFITGTKIKTKHLIELKEYLMFCEKIKKANGEL